MENKYRLEDQIKVTVNNDQMVQYVALNERLLMILIEDVKEIRKALSDMKAQLIGYMNFRDDSEMYDYEAYLLWRWENDDKFKNLNDGNTEMGS